MKKIYYLFFFTITSFSLFGNDGVTNKYNVSNIPMSLNDDVDAVIREYHIDMKVNDLYSSTIKVHKVITLMNRKTNYHELEVYYNRFIKVNKVSAQIFDANGKLVKKFRKKEINDFSAVGGGTLHGDSRIKYVEANYGIYPYTVEFEYEIENRDTRIYPDWYIIPSSNTSVESTSYSLKMPKDLKIRYKAYNYDKEPVITELGNTTIYFWQAKDVEPIRAESFSPRLEKVIPMVKIEPNRFQLDGRFGDMSTWESIGAFYYKLNAGRDYLASEVVNELKKTDQRCENRCGKSQNFI